MIYDCFTYSGEREVLEIRMAELKDLDAVHVLVESNMTFTGNEKKYTSFYDFPHIHPRLISIYVDDMPIEGDEWAREAWQRNAIMRGLSQAQYNDIIIISDVDEIPKAEAIKSYTPEMGLTALKMDVFWYRLNCLAERQTWVHPRIMPFSYLKDKTPDEVRRSGYESVIENAGFHFSYLGNEDFIINKLNSFSHQEYNIPEFKDKEMIREKIDKGHSLWGMSKFEFVSLDDSFPKYILENKERFKHLIKEL